MDNNNKHPWEEEAWVEMQKMLDDDLPTVISAAGFKRYTWIVLSFFLFSFASWFLFDSKPTLDVSDTVTAIPDIYEQEVYSYSMEIRSTLNNLKSDARRNLSQTQQRSMLDAAYIPKNESLSTVFSIGGSQDIWPLNHTGGVTQSLPYNLSLSSVPSIHDPEFVFTSLNSSNMQLVREGTKSIEVRPIVDAHVQHQDGRYFGGGIFMGVTFSGRSKWEGSLSTGYQYLRMRRLHADNGFSVPLVLPGADPNMGSSEEVSSPAIDLPAIQVHGHRFAFQGQMNRELSRKFSLGGFARISVDWTSLSPDIRNSPMRYHYPDLSFNKKEFRSRHLNIGLGMEAAYSLSAQWKFYTRGLLSKQFASLTSNRSYLESHLWTIESGFYYQF